MQGSCGKPTTLMTKVRSPHAIMFVLIGLVYVWGRLFHHMQHCIQTLFCFDWTWVCLGLTFFLFFFFVFFSVHYIKKAVENRRRIAAEIQRCRQLIDCIMDNHPQANVIVAGDVNDGPGADL